MQVCRTKTITFHTELIPAIHTLVTSRLNYCNPPCLGRKPHVWGSPWHGAEKPICSPAQDTGNTPVCCPDCGAVSFAKMAQFREPALISIPKGLALVTCETVHWLHLAEISSLQRKGSEEEILPQS